MSHQADQLPLAHRKVATALSHHVVKTSRKLSGNLTKVGETKCSPEFTVRVSVEGVKIEPEDYHWHCNCKCPSVQIMNVLCNN